MVVTLEGKQYPVKFTTYTAKIMHELTGINLYDLNAIAKIFGDEDKNASAPELAEGALPNSQKMSVQQFETFGKFLFASMAAGAMPEDADDSWKPPFTLTAILNKISINDAQVISDLTAAYLGMSVEEFKAAAAKNAAAPPPAGPSQSPMP